MVTLLDDTQIALIQGILGVTADGIWGKKSQAALDKIVKGGEHNGDIEHETYASSFADPADIDAFYKCKADGHSGYGDNGVGCFGDSTVEGTGPSCALPPEYMEARWGSVKAAKHKRVKVVLQEKRNKSVVCVLKDRMPHVENLANEARIDLNPDACKALGLEPPIMVPCVWWWTEEQVT